MPCWSVGEEDTALEMAVNVPRPLLKVTRNAILNQTAVLGSRLAFDCLSTPTGTIGRGLEGGLVQLITTTPLATATL